MPLLETVIILAAGASKRAGEPKALRFYRGVPWVVHVASTWRGLGVGEVIVTWNPALEIPGELGAASGVTMVPNHELALGPFRSLQLGLEARTRDGAVAVSPIDVPPPSTGTLGALLEALESAPAAKPVHRGKGGHPVMLSGAEAARMLRQCPHDARLDLLLAPVAARVEVNDPMVVMNLNDGASWTRFLEESAQG